MGDPAPTFIKALTLNSTLSAAVHEDMAGKDEKPGIPATANRNTINGAAKLEVCPQEPFMHRPVPAVIAILHHQGEFLLVQRRNPPDAGLWGHAGGKVEWGETLACAAQRELVEETGLRAGVAGHLAPLDLITPGQPGFHFVLCPVVCRYAGGQAVAGDDAMAVDWFSLATMRANPAAFSHYVPEICEQALHAFSGMGSQVSIR